MLEAPTTWTSSKTDDWDSGMFPTFHQLTSSRDLSFMIKLQGKIKIKKNLRNIH